MPELSDPSEFFQRMHCAGWSIGEAAFDYADGRRVWVVSGTKDGHTMIATARTQRDAWREACRLAEELGLVVS